MPGAARLITELRGLGSPVRLLSNNPTRDPAMYAVKLSGLGLPTAVADIANNVVTTVAWLAGRAELRRDHGSDRGGHGDHVPALLRQPRPDELATVMDGLGLSADQVLMVGDRLQTDIAMATRAGLDSAVGARPRRPLVPEQWWSELGWTTDHGHRQG